MADEPLRESPSPPSAASLHLWQIQGVRDVLVILIVCAVIWVGYWLRDVTVPLLIAVALAYLFEPLVQRLTRFRGITRTGAVTIILLTVGVGATIFITLTAPVAIGQTVSLVNRLRDGDYSGLATRAIDSLPEQYRDDLRPAVEWLSQGKKRNAASAMHRESQGASDEGDAGAANAQPSTQVPQQVGANAAVPKPPLAEGEGSDAADDDARLRRAIREEIDALGLTPVEASPAVAAPPDPEPRSAPWRVLGALGPTAERVGAIFLAIVQYSLILFLIPFYFWFFSVSFPKLLDFGRSVLPRKNRARTLELIGLMDRAVSGFVRGRIVISVIMGILFALGWLICGVPYAITLGLFVGALSLVPYLGGVGVPLAVGLLAFDQLQLAPEIRMAWWGWLTWPTAVFVIVQSVEGYILTPLIAGKATDLDPVTIVVAIIAGGSVAGVYGMLLAIPFAACGKILIIHLVLPSVRAWSRGETADPLPIEPIPTPVVDVTDSSTEQ